MMVQPQQLTVVSGPCLVGCMSAGLPHGRQQCYAHNSITLAAKSHFIRTRKTVTSNNILVADIDHVV